MNENMMFQYLLSFLLGTISGSAMTCLGERMATGKSWIKGRSECDVCHHVLHAGDLVPVLSYFIHQGRCHYCGTRLSVRYIGTEITGGIVFVWILLLEKEMDFQVILQWSICSILLALSITDLDCYQIPDELILVLLVLWFLRTGIEMNTNQFSHWNLSDSLAGALIPVAGVWFLSVIMTHILKKETMGGGDIKLMFVMGLHNGLWLNLMTLIFACIFGLFFSLFMKKEKIPFGPSLSLGMLVVILFRHALSSVWFYL